MLQCMHVIMEAVSFYECWTLESQSNLWQANAALAMSCTI